MSSLEPLPDQVLSMIDAKVGGLLSQKIAWQNAASRALAHGLPANDLLQVISVFGTSRSLDHLTRLARANGETLERFSHDLRRRSDESSYSIQAWLAAAEAMLLYLEASNRRSAPATILGYLDCASEFAAATGAGSLPLREVVLEMLEQHGFDG